MSLWFVVLSLATLSLFGCLGVIKVGQTVKAPNGEQLAVVVGYSAPGESFAQRGMKTFYLSVLADDSSPAKYLFKKDLKVVATWPDWSVRWISVDEIEFTICESETEVTKVDRAMCDRRSVAKVRARRSAGEREFHE